MPIAPTSPGTTPLDLAVPRGRTARPRVHAIRQRRRAPPVRPHLSGHQSARPASLGDRRAPDHRGRHARHPDDPAGRQGLAPLAYCHADRAVADEEPSDRSIRPDPRRARRALRLYGLAPPDDRRSIRDVFDGVRRVGKTLTVAAIQKKSLGRQQQETQ